MAQWDKNLTSVHEDEVSIPGLLSGLRIWCCLKLQHRSQMQLGSGVAWLWCRPAAAVPIPPPCLGTSTCHKCGPKKGKKKNKTKQQQQKFIMIHS